MPFNFVNIDNFKQQKRNSVKLETAYRVPKVQLKRNSVKMHPWNSIQLYRVPRVQQKRNSVKLGTAYSCTEFQRYN